LSVLSGLVLESGRRWGEAAEPLQWDDARAVLEPGAGPRRHWLGRARGRSKTTDVAGMTLSVLLTEAEQGGLQPGSVAYAGAADKDQARLLLDAARRYVAQTPELRGVVDVQAYRIVVPQRDVLLEVLTADGPSAYGLLPAWLVLDELCQWPETANARLVYDALTSSLPKVRGSRAAIMTTAGDPGHWSRKVYEHAQRSRLWRVSDAEGPAPWMSAEELADERERLLPSVYARLFLNRWTAPEDRLTTLDAVRECVRDSPDPLDPRPGVVYACGLDLAVTRDNAVLVVAHLEQDDEEQPRVVCDLVRTWTPSKGRPVDLAEVETAVARVSAEYGRAAVAFDPAKAELMTQRLHRAGVSVEQRQFTVATNNQRAQMLFRLLQGRRLSLPNDEQLVDELAAVRLVETSPGVFRLDHDRNRHDDRATALALAAQHLLEQAEKPKRRLRFRTAATGRYEGPFVSGPQPAEVRAPWESRSEQLRKARDAAWRSQGGRL
jgi:phage terminase large subunit-like protein